MGTHEPGCRVVVGKTSYDEEAKRYLRRSDHYLGNPPPGALFAIGVRAEVPGLFGPVGGGQLMGLCLVGRPVARALPQDGSMGEVTRLHLQPGLPYGTASRVLRYAADIARARGMDALISYHERGRHTGCVYRKAGFRHWGPHPRVRKSGWKSRARSDSAGRAGLTAKRRWLLVLR
jgi:hypothetical protein